MASFLPLSLGSLDSAPGAPPTLKRRLQEAGPAWSGDDAARVPESVLDLTRAVGARLSALDRRVAGGDELTAAQRTTLADLAKRGPTTLPQLARARSVSRQQVRVVVESLSQLGLVRRVPNPAHRRSYLVGVTDAGSVQAQAIGRRDAVTMSKIEEEVGAGAVRAATSALRVLLKALGALEG